MIINGDCIEVMRGMESNSVDTVITDPPYGLKFMGKKWDYDIPSIEIWKECLRVAKPGATLLCFGGSRTYHRMACAIEDAGWVIKDCIMWLYGSGFPKALDISKQMDKRGGMPQLPVDFAEALKKARIKRNITKTEADEIFCGGTTLYSWFEGRAGGIQLPTQKYMERIVEKFPEMKKFEGLAIAAERECIGIYESDMGGLGGNRLGEKGGDITIPKTEEAKQWNGWKSHGLKPAYEPILVAIKPNDGAYVDNALKWGVSGLNIDECRIGYNGEKPNVGGRGKHTRGDGYGFKELGDKIEADTKGRFPANIILDEEAGKMLDEQSGFTKTNADQNYIWNNTTCSGNTFKGRGKYTPRSDKGGASRFFYCAKASKSEKNAGVEGGCSHPTVKPLKLMEYLCRLTKTPTGGVVLDPFAGSCSTACACIKTGRKYIMIEKDKDYYEIGKARIKYYEKEN